MSAELSKTPFALTASELLVAAGRSLGDSVEEKFAWWADFADATGPALLPFLTRPEEYAHAPLAELGLAPTPLKSLTPRRGEMWVLFCFRKGRMTEALRASALRVDGFPLILEWRKGSEDSPLLSSALRALGAQVRRQFGVEGWCLHPAFDRYGDTIDFTDRELFSDAEHVDNIASAWGALAAGFWCVTTGRFAPEWTFPTIQWDEKRACAAGVAGLREKLSVAADCGASVVTVARSQRREASGILQDLRSESDGRRYKNLRLYPVRDRRSPKDAAAEVALGFSDSRRLRHRIAAAILIPLLSVLSLWGVYCWDTHRAFSKYYAAVVYHYGLPEGKYEVSLEAQRRRWSAFRFDYEGVHEGHCIHRPWQLKSLFGKTYRLVRVVHVNSRDIPCPVEIEAYGQMPMIQEFQYHENGLLWKVLCRKRGGKNYVEGPIEKQVVYDSFGGVPNGQAALRSGYANDEYYYGEVSQSQVDPALPQEAKNEIIEYVLIRDVAGRVVRKEFRNRLEPVCDGDGVWGFGFEYNADGLIARQINLDIGMTNGCPNQWGVATTSFSWSGPLLTNVVFRNVDGHVTRDRIGVMQWLYRHDADGNPTSARVLDETGSETYNIPTKEWPHKFSQCIFSWTNGLMRSMIRLGLPGQEANVLLDNGKTPPGFAWERNDRGDVVTEMFVDAHGRPATNAFGVCTSRFAIDHHSGKVLHCASFGLDGRSPVRDVADGVHSYSNTVDASGNFVDSRFLDEAGRLTTNRFGTAFFKSEYDQQNRLVYQAHFDIEGKSRTCGSFSAVQIHYSHGRVSEWRFCAGDALRTLSTNNDGVASIVIRYDDFGRLIRRDFYALPGTGNSIFAGAKGTAPPCARYEMLYDGRGNATSVKYYGDKGDLLKLRNKKYAYSFHEYDCYGRCVAISLFDDHDRQIGERKIINVNKRMR